jgi:hypothetical protein
MTLTRQRGPGATHYPRNLRGGRCHDRSVSTHATSGPDADGRTVGEEPKPRVLLRWEGPEHDRIYEVLRLHAPTIQPIDLFAEVRQHDYDVLVTDSMGALIDGEGDLRDQKGPEAHLCVISFFPASAAAGTWATADICVTPDFMAIDWKAGLLSKSIRVPGDVLPAAQDLVNDDLVPVARSRHSHTYLETSTWRTGRLPPLEFLSSMASSRATMEAIVGPAQTKPKPKDILVPRPFLLTTGSDPKILAGCYLRSEQSEGWAVPSDVTRPWDWVAAAIRHWAITYGRFPLVGGWWEDPRWQTTGETAATIERKALKAKLASATAQLETEIAAATFAEEQAARDAAAGPRRLLTEKGDSLKEAVADALRRLGYAVTDRDQEEPPDQGGRTEDLGLVDPDNPTADLMVEVKGYDSGAKAGDSGSVLRHVTRAVQGGRSPAAMWWVINHWRKRPPDERGPVLAGEDSMIAEHAGDNPPLVVIDTKDLFLAVRAVEEGHEEAQAVRASLRAESGRWQPGFAGPPPA